jgi:menaquinone-dependent protoporphyrinogen oxidase
VANRVAEIVERRGFDVRVANVHDLPRSYSLAGARGVILIASVHAGAFEREMVRFVKRQQPALNAMPSAFVSVSLAQVTAQDATASKEVRAKARDEIQTVMDRFFRDTEWRPKAVRAIAGALPYTKYNFFIRAIMKRIVAKNHGPTDTSQDYTFTNWDDLEAFVEVFLAEVPRVVRASPSSSAGSESTSGVAGIVEQLSRAT